MPAKQAVTISDVARQAGLSVATVSRALNRSPKLDPQTAKRVFEAVEQLGYNAAPITGRATERSRMREKCYTVEVILSPQPEQKDMLQLNFFSNVYTGFAFLKVMNLPSSVYNMLPYIISLIVLAFTSKNSRAPKAEGIPYDKGQR